MHFYFDQVPTNLDAIIIGAGCGGLATAATLAKAGKKMLVLEQHDQGLQWIDLFSSSAHLRGLLSLS